MLDRLTAVQEKLAEAISKVTDVPGLPGPVREVLNQTRASLLQVVKDVRSREDLKRLRGDMEAIVAGAVDAIARGSAEDPGDVTTVTDVRHFCHGAIKYGAGAVDSVALIAGTFAASASVATVGTGAAISFGHFFALCAVMGLLYSLTIGACEIYAVTSLLTHEGAANPARDALRICAAPRRHPRGSDKPALTSDRDAEDVAGEGTASAEGKILAKTWAKLSLAGALPVFNDRHMQDRLDILISMLEARA